MKLLAIETATEACSAALCLDGAVSSRYEFAPRQHAELILTMVDSLLVEAGIKITALDFLAFGRGPGAFTGVRIATGVIQGLAFAADLPVVPISTLAVLAQGAAGQADYLLSAIDARMGEVYWGLFHKCQEVVELLGEEAVSKPEQVQAAADQQWFGVGSGWRTYDKELRQALNGQLLDMQGDAYPQARDIIPLAIRAYDGGAAVPAAQAQPVYLRNKVTG